MAVHYQGITNPDATCLIALAQDQIQILNDDYQGTNADITTWVNTASASFPGISNAESCIEFCLATQSHPTGYGLTNGNPAVTINTTSGDSDGNWSGYINIFVREVGNGILGYSPLGGSGSGDGVVIDDQAFGSGSGCGVVAPGAPYNLGRTLTHELGHYLNLDHIWGNCNSNCCNSDDNVSDTPNSTGPNYGCPALGLQSCSSNDLHMNYMDYTNDACMYMFSAGQATRMENYVAANLTNVSGNAAIVCAAPTCDDGIQNQDETGVDCGGATCPACPTCDDGILNQDELAIDCGGATCPPCLSCTNGVQDGDETGIDCGGTLCNACPTCTDGIQNQDETGVDCGGATCPVCPVCQNITITINFDNYPEETSWTLTDAAAATIGSGGTYPAQPDGSTLTFNFCLDPGCYDFTMLDSYGDGICCGYGNGSYAVTLDADATVLASGATFTDSETTNFCITEDVVPGCTDNTAHNYDPLATVDDGSCQTCIDGILNGDETEIDCGGALCPSCPVPGCTDNTAHNYNPMATVDDGSCQTCIDGTLNGDETAIDCGGVLCPSCPVPGCTDNMAHNYDPLATVDDGSCQTCIDGTLNGDETEIDCGGMLCSPCVTGCMPFDSLSGATTADLTVEAENYIASTTVISGSINVIYWAGDYIKLNAGFSVALGTEFLADIQACTPAARINPDHENSFGLQLAAKAENGGTIVSFSLTKAETVSIDILTPEGRKLVTLSNQEAMAAGTHQLQLNELNLKAGLYLCKIKVGDVEQIIKIPVTR